MRLYMSIAQYVELRHHLFDAVERVTFLFTRTTENGDASVAEVQLLDEHDYQWHHGHGVELADHVRPGLIRTAHANGFAVVEAHAHDWPGPNTRFSNIDLDGLRDLGPHMTWRLPGRPYTALVLGPDSFDALQWLTGGEIATIDALVMDGERMSPTGLSFARLVDTPTRRLR